MKALLIKSNGKVQLINVENELKALQTVIGGYIETVTLSGGAVALCDEDGRAKRLPHSCTLEKVAFVGPVLIVGADGDEFTDVPDMWIRFVGIEEDQK